MESNRMKFADLYVQTQLHCDSMITNTTAEEQNLDDVRRRGGGSGEVRPHSRFMKLWAEVEETLLCRSEPYQKHNRKNPCSDSGFTSDAPPAHVTWAALHIQNTLTSVGPVTTQKCSSRSAEL